MKVVTLPWPENCVADAARKQIPTVVRRAASHVLGFSGALSTSVTSSATSTALLPRTDVEIDGHPREIASTVKNCPNTKSRPTAMLGHQVAGKGRSFHGTKHIKNIARPVLVMSVACNELTPRSPAIFRNDAPSA